MNLLRSWLSGGGILGAIAGLALAAIPASPAESQGGDEAKAAAELSRPASPESVESPADSPALRRAQSEVFRAALQKIEPCIVRIETIGGAQPVERRETPEGEEVVTATEFRAADGPTTGVIWSADGLIVTSSFNFIRNPSIITVSLSDGRRYVARLLARDSVARLALLKIAAADLPTPRLLPSGEVRVGQWAVVAGFGFGGRHPAVSVGIVSGLGRLGGLAVQADARVSPANYGGPLFDAEGRLIGICVPTAAKGEDEIAGVEWYDSGIGFAIGSDVLARRVPRLARGTDFERGVMGVELEPTDPVAGEETPPGVKVLSVSGPAAEGGVKEGDRIVQIDGHPAETLYAVRCRMVDKAAGDAVELVVRRGDKRESLKIVLVRQAQAESQPATRPVLLRPPGSQPAP